MERRRELQPDRTAASSRWLLGLRGRRLRRGARAAGAAAIPTRTGHYATLQNAVAVTLPAVRLAAAYHRCVEFRVLSHGGEPIRCDPSGCCLWTARSSVAAARRRLYEASRGALSALARIENVCRYGRCVNLDHLRIVSRAATRTPSPGVSQCHRGHELTPENVVRHRDGRVAYCRLCRNDRRRERYRSDPAFARREITRQRALRRRASPQS